MRSLVIQISGKQGAGKDSLKDVVEKHLVQLSSVGVAVIAYADPMYRIMRNVLRDMMEFGIKVPTAPDGSPLKDGDLLQSIGSWGRRVYGEDVWIRIARNRVHQNHVLFESQRYAHFVTIVSDLRFLDEAEAFPGSLKYRLDCPETVRKARILATPGQNWRENTTHRSEVELDEYTGFTKRFDSEKLSAQEIGQAVLGEIHHCLANEI